MNDLEKFFSRHDFTTQLLSVCCGERVTGEMFKTTGRCSGCLEMTEFEESGE